jgi:hypothetical protein
MLGRLINGLKELIQLSVDHLIEGSEGPTIWRLRKEYHTPLSVTVCLYVRQFYRQKLN